MSSVGAAKKLSRARACSDCGHQMPVSRTFCPHCGRPQLFPNVELAKDEIEKQKLAARHKEALERCRERGCENVAIAFEAACDRTAAVFACPLHRLHREVCTGTEIYETYHDLERLRLRATAPGRFDWAKLHRRPRSSFLDQPNISKRSTMRVCQSTKEGSRPMEIARFVLRNQ